MCHKTRQAALGRTLESIDRPKAETALVDAFESRSLIEDEEGRAFYAATYNFCRRHGSVETMAGVVAALSPQNGWARNKQMARKVASGQRTGIGHFHEDRALAIYDGQPWRDVLGGRKVRSFAPNMSHPDRPGPVTIDRHMCDLMGIDPRVLERAGGYVIVAGIVRKVARTYGLLPHVFQAIVWVVQRNRTGASVWG